MSTPMPLPRNVSALPFSRGARPQHKWKLRAFDVHRKEDKKIRPYRSVVYTTQEDSADLAIGLSGDEFARRVRPSFWDGVGASAKVTPEELVDFWENCGMTLTSGGTEAAAIVRSTRMASTPRMRGILGVMRWRMNQGAPLHAALAEFPSVFHAEQVALAEAGQELVPDARGRLFISLAEVLREQTSRGRKFWASMLDQIITAVMLVVLVLVTVVFFAPTFVGMFESMGLETPYPYLLAKNIGSAVKTYWMIAVPAAALGGGIVWKSLCAFFGSKPIQKFLARAKITGPVVRGMALARSLPVFAVLHKAGTPPKRTFALAGSAAANALVEQFFRDAYDRCEGGCTIEQAMMAERMTLGLEDGRRLAGKVEAGSESGDLEVVLRGLSNEFSQVAVARLEALPKVIKPINYLIMGVVISLVGALVSMPAMLALEKTFKQQNEEAKARFEHQSK